MTLRYACLILISSILVIGGPLKPKAAEQVTRIETKTYPLVNIPFIELKSVALDGIESEQEWSGAKSLNLPFITRPFEKLPAPVSTEVKVFENGTELFVLFVADDPRPEQIRAFLRDRDNAYGDDLVGIKLDPFNDGRLAYQFYVNPLGVQTDSIENEMTGNESTSWNGIWESAGRLTETGFVVEIKIPLRLLNFEESEGEKRWGIEFVRFYPRSDSYRLSHVPFDRNNACNLCQMGTSLGFENAKQAQNIAIVPTLVASAARQRQTEPLTPWSDENNQELGLDLSWGITPEINLTGTLNPDFSQVEADAAQINVNNTFALFFNEQRPFFVENQDYFSTNQNLVYTRNINAPDYGAKVTGRKDKHSIGFFVANDQGTAFLVPGNLGSSVARLEEKSINLATRYRFDYSDDLSVGIVSTIRDSDNYSNLVSGVDTRYRLSDKDTIRAQFVRSETQYPTDLSKRFCRGECEDSSEQTEASLRTQSEDKLNGNSYLLYYDRDTENYFIDARRTVTESDFRADLGFVSNVDRARYIFGGGYFWLKEDAWWNRIRINGDWDITHNDAGELIERELEAYLSIRGLYQSFFEIGSLKRSRVGLRADQSSLSIDNNTSMFEEESHSMYFETSPTSLLSYRSFLRVGDRVDLINNRLGKQTYIEQGLSLNLGRHLKFDFDFTRSSLDANNRDLFTADLFDIRASYQFDPRQFLRIIVTHSFIERNLDNYTSVARQANPNLEAERTDVGFQLLYSYKVNPLTKFFLGFSQSAVNNDTIDTLRPNSQSIFLKFSYAYFP